MDRSLVAIGRRGKSTKISPYVPISSNEGIVLPAIFGPYQPRASFDYYFTTGPDVPKPKPSADMLSDFIRVLAPFFASYPYFRKSPVFLPSDESGLILRIMAVYFARDGLPFKRDNFKISLFNPVDYLAYQTAPDSVGFDQNKIISSFGCIMFVCLLSFLRKFFDPEVLRTEGRESDMDSFAPR